MRHKSEELMKQIMDYAEQFQLLNHRSPYTSEIADALGIVKSTVYKYLVAMNDRGMLSYRNGEIVTERTNKISLLTKPAAVLGSVSCGMPQLEEEYIEEYVSLPVSLFGEGEFFILRASGDSMIGAGINSGDMIVIRKQNTASDGDIVVALVDNEFLLAFYTAMILLRTVLNREIWFDPLGKLFGGWGLYEDEQFTTESIENFMLFVPFSILLLWAFQKELLGESENIRFGKTVWEATKVVAVFSFLIEFTQLLFHLGTFQISDLTYNTLGGAVGGVIYYLGYSRKRKK